MGGYPTITGGPIPCKKGVRNDFELAITREVPGYIDWFGKYLVDMYPGVEAGD